MSETGLVRYDEMCRAIEACHAIDEVKDYRDKALALEKYAQVAMNTEAERKACEVRLRAERRAGQLLSEREKAQGGTFVGKDSEGSVIRQTETTGKTLNDIGITRDQSSRWQKLAKVDNETFESALADPEEKPSTSGILRKANGDTESKVHPDALWIWGRIRDFERMEISQNSPSMIAGEMTDAMRADVCRIVSDMAVWLMKLKESIENE